MERMTFDIDSNSENFKKFAVPTSLVADPATRQVKGYAAVWGVVGSEPGQFTVLPQGSMILPTYPVVLLYNHKADYQLATEDNKTLTLQPDNYGLGITATLDQTFIEDFILTKMASGTIKGMSLGMYIVQQHKDQRLITAQDASGNPALIPYLGKTIPIVVYDKWILFEVTIGGCPVFPQTNITTFARKSDEEKEEFDCELRRYETQANLLGFMLE